MWGKIPTYFSNVTLNQEGDAPSNAAESAAYNRQITSRISGFPCYIIGNAADWTPGSRGWVRGEGGDLIVGRVRFYLAGKLERWGNGVWRAMLLTSVVLCRTLLPSNVKSKSRVTETALVLFLRWLTHGRTHGEAAIDPDVVNAALSLFGWKRTGKRGDTIVAGWREASLFLSPVSYTHQ